MVGTRVAAEEGVARPEGAPGAICEGEDHGQQHTLLDAHQSHHQDGDSGQSELQAVEAESAPTDRWRSVPISAYSSDPATKA